MTETVELKPCPLCQAPMMFDHFVDWEGQPLADKMIIHQSDSACPLADIQVTATDDAIAAWNRRPALEALAAKQSTGGMVKGLEWEDRGSLIKQFRADTIAGIYYIERNGETFDWWNTVAPFRHGFDTLEAAKAAAQADFEQRVLSCLVNPFSPVNAEPVAAKCDGQLCYYHGCQRLDGCVQHPSPEPVPPAEGEPKP